MLTYIGFRNKFSMPRSNRQTFVACGTLARSRGKKLHELDATLSHNTFLLGGLITQKLILTISDKSIDNSYMRHSSNRVHYSDGDPFNPMTNVPQDFTLIGSSDCG